MYTFTQFSSFELSASQNIYIYFIEVYTPIRVPSYMQICKIPVVTIGRNDPTQPDVMTAARIQPREPC
jgi:hypothetical protein